MPLKLTFVLDQSDQAGHLLALCGGVLLAVSVFLKAIAPPVAAAFITALVGLFGVLCVQWQSKGRDIAESHRPSKIEIYNTFFGIVERIQNTNTDSSKAKDDEDWIKAEFKKLNRGLILWASPDVIRAWLAFRTHTESGKHVLVAVDAMYQAIRKDLGNSNSGLRTGDLMKIGLKDPNEWRE